MKTKQMKSTDDARTANAVRHNYRTLSYAEKEVMALVKDTGLALIEAINACGKSRETSIALTKAEEAVMWAVKGLTK